MKYSIVLPNGWTMSLVEIKDPVEAYEAMTNVAKAADEAAHALVPAFFKPRLNDTSLVGTPATIRQRITALEALGVQEILLDLPSPTDLTPLYRFAQEFIA